jgi:hypothetical protein
VRVCSDRGPDGEADDIASRSACRGLGTSRAAIETLCGNEERRRPGEFGTCPRQICATVSTKGNCKVVMTRYPIGSELRRFHVPRPQSRDNCGVVEPRLNQSELEHCTSPLHHLTPPSHNHCKRIGCPRWFCHVIVAHTQRVAHQSRLAVQQQRPVGLLSPLSEMSLTVAPCFQSAPDTACSPNVPPLSAHNRKVQKDELNGNY